MLTLGGMWSFIAEDRAEHRVMHGTNPWIGVVKSGPRSIGRSGSELLDADAEVITVYPQSAVQPNSD